MIFVRAVRILLELVGRIVLFYGDIARVGAGTRLAENHWNVMNRSDHG